eukprot:jgi/Chrzof1/12727/Cz07g05120.t1
MGYVSAEEVSLPTRFLTTTAHFVAVLTVLFGVDTLTGQVLVANNITADPNTSDFAGTRKQLQSLAYAAIACFCIEYVGLFLGVSIFFRGHCCLYIFLHFMGAVLTALFYTGAWSVAAFTAFFVIFNILPAVLELLTFAVVTKASLSSY